MNKGIVDLFNIEEQKMGLLVNDTIMNYASILASSEPAPGGGSAAALVGAIGVSLASMVGSLTEGRAKYAEHAEFVAGLLEQARILQKEFLVLVDEDVKVFNAMSSAYKLPKNTDADKASRMDAIQTALIDCTIAPYKMMELCLRALELTAQAMGKTNLNVVSDLGVAAVCLKAAAQGAWLNVLINLSSLRDAAFIAEYGAKGAELLDRAVRVADEVYEKVKNGFN